MKEDIKVLNLSHTLSCGGRHKSNSLFFCSLEYFELWRKMENMNFF